MKTIKTIFSVFALIVLMTSCIDENTLADDIAASPNLIGFVGDSDPKAIVVDGSGATLDFMVNVRAFGPTSISLSEDINSTISIDPASTAILGTHFTMDDMDINLSTNNNFIDGISITMLSSGIAQGEEFELILNLEHTGNIGVSSKTGQVKIQLKYLCSSNLAGVYSNPDCVGSEATITQVGDGEYVVSDIPYLSAGGTPLTFKIFDNCGVITIDGTLDVYTNLVLGSGEVSLDGNSITINYILYNGGSVSDGIYFDYSTEADASTYTLIP